MKASVIIDTSIWIDVLKGKESGKILNLVVALVAEGKAVITDIIKHEMLIGCRNKRQFNELKMYLDDLDIILFYHYFMEELTIFNFELRREGVNIPFTDCQIAFLARKYRLPLLQKDRHFKLIAKVADLKLYEMDEASS